MQGIGLIGLGRVGRRLLRELWQRGLGPQVRLISEINPSGRPGPELTANLAYLLAQDSEAGPFPAPVDATGQSLLIDGHETPLIFDRPPQDIEWPGSQVQVLIDASGDGRSLAAAASLAGGAVRKVLITRSADHAQATLVRGLNLDQYDPARHHVVSCSTCTANALAPVLAVLDQSFGIQRGSILSVHPALSSDTVLDGPHRCFTAGRSAFSLRPLPSQAHRTTAQLLPQLQGRLTSMSLRTPTCLVNALHVDLVLSRPPADAAAVIALLERAEAGHLAGVMGLERGVMGRSRAAVDFAGDPRSALVDLNWLHLGGPLLRLLIWHDNEYAYCCRVADTLQKIIA